MNSVPFWWTVLRVRPFSAEGPSFKRRISSLPFFLFEEGRCSPIRQSSPPLLIGYTRNHSNMSALSFFFWGHCTSPPFFHCRSAGLRLLSFPFYRKRTGPRSVRRPFLLSPTDFPPSNMQSIALPVFFFFFFFFFNPPPNHLLLSLCLVTRLPEAWNRFFPLEGDAVSDGKVFISLRIVLFSQLNRVFSQAFLFEVDLLSFPLSPPFYGWGFLFFPLSLEYFPMTVLRKCWRFVHGGDLNFSSFLFWLGWLGRLRPFFFPSPLSI